jgi:hypothetical protein
VRVYESPPAAKDNINPKYYPVKLKFANICNADLNTNLKISFYSENPSGTDILYGESKEFNIG